LSLFCFAFENVQPASHLIVNRNVLLTRRENTLYVHFYKDAISEALKFAPINIAPKRATLLNDGRPVEFAVEFVPTEHLTKAPCLRLRHLPVNELPNTVLVVKLEFERLPESIPAPAPIGQREQTLQK